MTEFFRTKFFALTDHNPHPWQESLFLKMAAGEAWLDFRHISLPTGTGKTAIMAIWVLALAWQSVRAKNRKDLSIPRRLIWVVNRRVVVDQATADAEQLSLRLANPDKFPDLRGISDALASLSVTKSSEAPLAISTLRGQFADNAAWRNDPARPSIVVGTVDMIGSRLLFSGYGRGFKSKPLHAAFLGQDALLVHDEAHLEPAFQKLIEVVESEQQRCCDPWALRIMALTATSRGDGKGAFTLTEADYNADAVRKVIEAKKGLKFSPSDEVADAIYGRACEFRESGQAIVIFLRQVKDVKAVAAKLRKHDSPRVQTLTGTMRGLERDILEKDDPVFERFKREPGDNAIDGTVYLVCTSAGEVGINISADHLIADLTPYDSMAQRFGRVNRFGDQDALIDVVYEKERADKSKEKRGKPAYDKACKETRSLLEKLNKRDDDRYDASPKALLKLEPDPEIVFSPPPVILPVTDILFDAWALTSIRGALPGRPPVADWLHGISERDPPETWVAWREEVEVITPDLQESYKPEDLLEDYPLKPHELLRDTTIRVLEELKGIVAREPECHAWHVAPDGTVRTLLLADVIKESEKSPASLADSVILLPPKAGGLAKGMLHGATGIEESCSYDVADKWDDSRGARRCRVWGDTKAPPGMRRVRTIIIANDEDESATAKRWQWFVRPQWADDDGSRNARIRQRLDVHHEAAERVAAALSERLVSTPDEARAVALAARWHDLGKCRVEWRRSIGINDSNDWWAKSGRDDKQTTVWTGYRHEFGSLLDLRSERDFVQLSPDMQELVLHLIAAHHGRARPHFPVAEAFDFNNSEQDSMALARHVPVRFARLQRKYGRWGLAYLESLVRAADALASPGGGFETDSEGLIVGAEAVTS